MLDHTVTAVDGSEVSLADYRGQAVLIVNVASECGYTPQLEGLQTLHDRYSDRGFAVLGFPCNDFGSQAPGSSQEEAAFCSNQYGVDFPVFAKVGITGEGDPVAPLYHTLQTDTPEGISGPVEWNFTKFLVNPEGEVVARFAPPVEPLSDELVAAVEDALPR